MKEYEEELYSKGYKLIAGIDEVGRGPLVGPVVCACVILPVDYHNPLINDSKKLSEKRRNELFKEINEVALGIGIGVNDSKRIDEINILEATKEAMKKAIKACNIRPDYVLIDAVKLDIDIPSTSIIKGDAKSESIAAASIIAKVTRDAMMYELDKIHPEYDFAHNKGYGTKKHLEALEKYGALKEHRVSFSPVKKCIKN